MIWLVGRSGMLGAELAEALNCHRLAWVGSGRDIDIRDPEALSAFAASREIDWIINCAAYTAVDKAECENELVFSLNVEGPKNLACLASQIGARLIHISTDYVFSGMAHLPYDEMHDREPIGVYGRTKADGEIVVRELCAESVIVRTAWLYGKFGPNFVYTMLRLMRNRYTIDVVADQKSTPTWTFDLAEAIVKIVSAPRTQFGIYHFTDGGEASWFEFALEIYRLGRMNDNILHRECEIRPIASSAYPTVVKRPRYSVLSKDRIVKDYKLTIPEWRDSLFLFLSSLSADSASLRERICQ